MKDREALDAYLSQLQQNPISEKAPKEERLAYFINLYNAGTVQLILEHYPLNSIKDISRPWAKDIIGIGNKYYSLGDIEHKILRKMNEPRIHFAINCASYSCPKLLNKAFAAATMEAQLDNAARDFINDPQRNTLNAESLALSQIFNWFKKDFTKKESLIQFLNNYADITIGDRATVRYRKYDWNLNDDN